MRCPDLRELDLSDCTLLTSQTIDIVCNLRHLEYLSLSRCYNINVAAYLYVLLECHTMESMPIHIVFFLQRNQQTAVNRLFGHIRCAVRSSVDRVTEQFPRCGHQ